LRVRYGLSETTRTLDKEALVADADRLLVSDVRPNADGAGTRVKILGTIVYSHTAGGDELNVRVLALDRSQIAGATDRIAGK
jgi:hypothetical protein